MAVKEIYDEAHGRFSSMLPQDHITQAERWLATAVAVQSGNPAQAEASVKMSYAHSLLAVAKQLTVPAP